MNDKELRQLAELSKVASQLSEFTSVAATKEVRDKAEAVRVYMRIAGYGVEAQNAAAEVTVLADRRMGELLRDMEKDVGGRPKKTGSTKEPVLEATTLADLGITKKQSMSWQKLAQLPIKVFREVLSQVRQTGKPFSSATVLKTVQQLAKRQEKAEQLAEYEALPVTVKLSLPVNLVLADPPWQYDFVETESRAIENQYPSQKVEVICEHFYSDKMPPVQDDCVLFMWATAPKLREAFTVLDAWGFEYKTHAVWDKHHIGMGYWFRGQHELLLVGVRGSVSPPDADDRVSSIFSETRRKHSQKPECVYEWIEQAFPTYSKLEMYCRQPRDGWQVFGNDAQ